jgi:hypothetical protein
MTRNSALNAKHFHDEEAAFALVESILWPDGPTCPHCGGDGYPLQGVRGKDAIDRKTGKITKKGEVRIGLKKCRACRKQFTVRIGTIFESSHVPLHLWLQAMYLLASSKKGISANQLGRTLGTTKRTAWFLAHRIRELMRDGDLAPPMGGGGGAVEADETFYRMSPSPSRGASGAHAMNKILALVDRNTGEARTFIIDKLWASEIIPILRANIAKEARLMTDEGAWYMPSAKEFAEHGAVNHSQEEYARGDIGVNSVEGFFSILKKGLRGVYQRVEAQHLHRYAGEFAYRYTHRIARGVDDDARFVSILKRAKGRRLTYQTAGGKEPSDAGEA